MPSAATASRAASAASPDRDGVGHGQPQFERGREQALLGAVVHIALESAAGDVGGLDDARPGRAQVVELGEDLGAQPLVVDGEAGGGADLPLEVVRARRRG